MSKPSRLPLQMTGSSLRERFSDRVGLSSVSDDGPGDVLLVIDNAVGGPKKPWVDGRVSARVGGMLNK